MKITRALISVSDKSGLDAFARGLHDLGVELLSTGGSAAYLRGIGLPVVEVSDYTGYPECFDGRVKTLHPKVHGGFLYQRENPEHVARATELGVPPIDLLVVNLYPFEQTIAKPGVTFEDAVENQRPVAVFLLVAPLHTLLEKVVRGACFQAFDRFFGLDRSRDNDDRNVGTARSGQDQSSQAVEVWKIKVTEDQIMTPLCQCLLKGPAAHDMADLTTNTVVIQQIGHQHGIANGLRVEALTIHV